MIEIFGLLHFEGKEQLLQIQKKTQCYQGVAVCEGIEIRIFLPWEINYSEDYIFYSKNSNFQRSQNNLNNKNEEKKSKLK